MSNNSIKVQQEAMRERSGRITSSEPLVSFIYVLLRDHLPAGVVEEIVLKEIEHKVCVHTPIAYYVRDLAPKLVDAETALDRLESFLYVLLRDHLTSEIIEEIMLHNVDSEESVFTNGWLANYAKDLTDRLR